MDRQQQQFRVLFPYNRDRVGGSYISSAQLARYLHDETEFEPIIALPRNAKNRYLFDQYGLSIVEHDLCVSSQPVHAQFLGGRAKLFTRWLNTVRAWRMLGRLRPDFVHVHDDNSFNIWGRAAKWRGIPIIWHVRQEHAKPADAVVSKWADHIICISEGCRSRFNQLPHIQNRAEVVYNGIDLDEFKPLSDSKIAEVRSSLGLPVRSLVCGFVGNLVERKRPEWAYDAVSTLNTSGVPANLIFIGEDRGEPLYCEQFQELQGKEIMQDRVQFLGIRKDVNHLMGALDVLLVPSRPHGEPFSRVVAEACAMGIPVVASSGVGALELLNPGMDCIKVEESGSAGYVAAVVALCGQPERMAEIGLAAHEVAKRVFSYCRMGQETASLYRQKFVKNQEEDK